MIYLVITSHVCSNISSIIVINNDLKLPVLTLTSYFKMQVAHFIIPIGNVLNSFKPCMDLILDLRMAVSLVLISRWDPLDRRDQRRDCH